MKPKNPQRKRPCRICRKWFTPNTRLGDRQKTCGDKECQRRWHAKVCAEWNRKNRSYFKAIHLKARLEASGSSPPSPSSKLHESSGSNIASPLDLPREVIQEVMSTQQLIIIEYIVRLLTRGVQEAISIQLLEIQRKSQQLPLPGISRGDSPEPPS